MDLETAKSLVAKGREADRQLAEAEEVVRQADRRRAAEEKEARDRADAERASAAMRAVAEWLRECSAGFEKLRAEHGGEYERLLGTPAIPYFADGHETRMELRLAVAGLAYAAGVLRQRAPGAALAGAEG